MESALISLQREQREIDQRIIEYSIRALSPFYEKRRALVRDIPRFWAVAVGETEPWRPYITYEDSLAFDALVDLWIEWDPHNLRNFTATFTFDDNPHFGPQVLSKALIWKTSSSLGAGSEEPSNGKDIREEDRINEPNGSSDLGYYVSETPTEIKLKPGVKLLEQHLHGGQESFFTWFQYTNSKEDEDRRENTTIAQQLVDEIFPNAIDLYSAAQDDQDIEEEYDISPDET